ncbi:DUF6271 family protein [Actinokineospora inagensis]|uniref:DUF6271 family protein n=1 Tax=Actinokineospora inagensis TaxID=103730 RepID=UPI0003F99CE6|nr:DUF6271 family protein [Actinokineospora inagensis]
MRRICLTLPTNRECVATIAAIGEEAGYAVSTFDVAVVLLILDSSDAGIRAEHERAVARLPATFDVLHLDEDAQRDFLRRVVDGAGVDKPDLVLDLMLPDGVSYGACTNRAFVIARALGCESVHRRDSDSSYQEFNGAKVFPIHHELASIGSRAADAGAAESALDPEHLDKPVVMVGASFIGDLSVDIAEIATTDPEAYYDVVSLWAPGDWTEAQKRDLVAESFTGAGQDPFTGDRSVLGLVDPMRVDMCNIAFHQVQEKVPLPPATDTIGSDYFLIHLVHDAKLPGVLHNRHIVNFHTGERKTDAGFAGYQLRLAKFFLSMLYFHHIYDRMTEAGSALLDDTNQVRASVIAGYARESTGLAKAENIQRLTGLEAAYRRLGGRYAEFADTIAADGDRWLREAERDIEDFALLIDVWAALLDRASATPVVR